MQGKRATVCCLVMMSLSIPARSLGPAGKSKNPEKELPPNITQLTGFGERAYWSPDGKRIAFMGKSFGDAFEIDLESKLTRILTAHFQHAGFLRVQYLPKGDLLLIGARTFTDIRTTRLCDQEMWVMTTDAKTPPVALNQKIFEGVAISRKQMKIAWANTNSQYPDQFAKGESALYTADIVYSNGKATLANKKEVVRAKAPDCVLEPQDFRRNDTELIYTCYRAHPQGGKADIMGVDLITGKTITYRKIEGEYNEAEGISPDGEWILVESSREQGPGRQDAAHIDIWKLRLEPGSTDFVRLTRWGDYEGYKASNPVVSPDGKWIAFQSARSDEPAGVGHGIFLLRLEDRSAGNRFFDVGGAVPPATALVSRFNRVYEGWGGAPWRNRSHFLLNGIVQSSNEGAPVTLRTVHVWARPSRSHGSTLLLASPKQFRSTS